GCNENYRHFERAQHFVYCIEPRTAVSELYVGKDDSRPLSFGKRHGFAMCSGDSQHAMSETLDQPLEIKGDESLILDDQNIGCDFCRKFPTGFLDEIAQRWCIDIKDLCGIILGKSFERDQQERL